MSGIEVVAVVAGIVSAFTASVSFYHSWQQKKAERIIQAQNKTLEVSLTTGGKAVQTQYDVFFGRLGQKFAAGDGT